MTPESFFQFIHSCSQFEVHLFFEHRAETDELDPSFAYRHAPGLFRHEHRFSKYEPIPVSPRDTFAGRDTVADPEPCAALVWIPGQFGNGTYGPVDRGVSKSFLFH